GPPAAVPPTNAVAPPGPAPRTRRPGARHSDRGALARSMPSHLPTLILILLLLLPAILAAVLLRPRRRRQSGGRIGP
ncbi:hypothetical protein, partial [Streptomyces sp. SID3343]|uniref:hypothetical protein n=1 Tax=Streptomyces sp. SID3343 TaxID=2690260 RepID=UPI001F3EBFFA